MKSEDLAFEVESFIHEACSRVLGVGDEQYSRGDDQQFESMNMDDLIEYIEEELRDVAAYVTMFHIRLERMREEVAKRTIQSLQSFGDGHVVSCGVYSVGICTCLWKRKPNLDWRRVRHVESE